MAGRRKTIADAIVARLEGMTGIDDLVVSKTPSSATELVNQTQEIDVNRVILEIPRETIDTGQAHNNTTAVLSCTVHVFPKASLSAARDDMLDPMLNGVLGVLLTAAAEDPAFGVDGVKDVGGLAWEAHQLDTDAIVGASIDFTVNYRHNITDPTAYP